MYKQLDLFNKTQPSDLEKLEDMVSPNRTYQHTDNWSDIDYEIQTAYDSGDTVRYEELITIQRDMN